MTDTTQGPASPPPGTRVLLCPDGVRLAVRLPEPPGALLRISSLTWRIVHPQEGVVGYTDDDGVRDWIPLVRTDVLAAHVEHWATTADGRSGECRGVAGPDGCCEGVGSAMSDLGDLIDATREATWSTE